MEDSSPSQVPGSSRTQALETPASNGNIQVDKDEEVPIDLDDNDGKESGRGGHHAEGCKSTDSASFGPRESARQFEAPGKVRAGGAMLAFCAGMVNAVAFHALNTFVSHMTGSLSKAGLGMEDSGRANAGDSMLLVVSFVIGSMLTGLLIAKDTIQIGMSLYDMCLLCEASLLTCATFAHEHKISRYLAAAACGLQNGMATHWGGAVIRTTHVTGLFTDVGLMLGRRVSIFCRKRCGGTSDAFDRALFEDDLSKLSVLFTIAVSFLIGIYVGAHLYNCMKERAFLIPAGITGIAGSAYAVYRVFIFGRNAIRRRISVVAMDSHHGNTETYPNCDRSRADEITVVTI